jgi:hypothetical protein
VTLRDDGVAAHCRLTEMAQGPYGLKSFKCRFSGTFTQGFSQPCTYFLAELYHLQRNHQGLDNCLIIATEPPIATNGTVRKRQRLGVVLNFYYRELVSDFSFWTIRDVNWVTVAVADSPEIV